MTQITAVARCQKQAPTDYGTNVSFYPAYDSAEANQEWAKATPHLSIMMTVKNEVAERFEQGGEYLITFEKREGL